MERNGCSRGMVAMDVDFVSFSKSIDRIRRRYSETRGMPISLKSSSFERPINSWVSCYQLKLSFSVGEFQGPINPNAFGKLDNPVVWDSSCLYGIYGFLPMGTCDAQDFLTFSLFAFSSPCIWICIPSNARKHDSTRLDSNHCLIVPSMIFCCLSIFPDPLPLPYPESLSKTGQSCSLVQISTLVSIVSQCCWRPWAIWRPFAASWASAPRRNFCRSVDKIEQFPRSATPSRTSTESCAAQCFVPPRPSRNIEFPWPWTSTWIRPFVFDCYFDCYSCRRRRRHYHYHYHRLPRHFPTNSTNWAAAEDPNRPCRRLLPKRGARFRCGFWSICCPHCCCCCCYSPGRMPGPPHYRCNRRRAGSVAGMSSSFVVVVVFLFVGSYSPVFHEIE